MVWQNPGAVLVSIALGVLVGIWLPASRVDPKPTAGSVASVQPAQTGAPAVDPERLAELTRLRDEAEALTAAQVTLDERTQELWMPRVARIEAAREADDTPPQLREQLDATIVALERVGLLASGSS